MKTHSLVLHRHKNTMKILDMVSGQYISLFLQSQYEFNFFKFDLFKIGIFLRYQVTYPSISELSRFFGISRILKVSVSLEMFSVLRDSNIFRRFLIFVKNRFMLEVFFHKFCTLSTPWFSKNFSLTYSKWLPGKEFYSVIKCFEWGHRCETRW